MDKIIEIKINGSHLTRDSQTAGVQHEGNATVLRMEFDAGWDAFAKTVTFWNARGENPVKRILTTDLLENILESSRIYRCPIPPEAMTEAGKLSYIIDGMADGVRQRSVEDQLKVLPAGYEPEAAESTDPTPTQAEQLQVQVDALRGEVREGILSGERAKASADAAAASERNAAAKEQAAQQAATNAAASAGAAAASEAKAQGYAKQAEGLVTGVTSFNGRTGAVKPKAGDYTADMVGAVNPNILRDWYFGDPVDQRGGWLVPPGVDLHRSSDTVWIEKTTQYYPVEYFWSDGNPHITIGGVDYYVNGNVEGTHYVRGYDLQNNYAIAGWKGVGYSHAMLIRDGYIELDGSGIWLIQPLESSVMAGLVGRDITFSALFADNTLQTGTLRFTGEQGTFFARDNIFYEILSDNHLRIVTYAPDTHFNLKLKAAKLELGSVQTLAHQDESGAWVLNEIPDKNEELLRCCMSTADSTDAYANNKKTSEAVGAVPDARPYLKDIDILEWAASQTGERKCICDTNVTGLPKTGNWMVDLEYAPQGVWRILTVTDILTQEKYENNWNNGEWTGWLKRLDGNTTAADVGAWKKETITSGFDWKPLTDFNRPPALISYYNGWGTVANAPIKQVNGLLITSWQYAAGTAGASGIVAQTLFCENGRVFCRAGTIDNDNWGAWKERYLALDGSNAMTGTLYAPEISVNLGDGKFWLTGAPTDSGETNAYVLHANQKQFWLHRFINGEYEKAILYVDANGTLCTQTDKGLHTILHTGNKPSGSYTGNGVARTVDTGGIGSCVIIRNGAGCGIAQAGGMMLFTYSSQTWKWDSASKFENGIIQLSADNPLNANTEYAVYQVL